MNKFVQLLLTVLLGLFFMIPVISLSQPTGSKEDMILFLTYTFILCLVSARSLIKGGLSDEI